MDRVYYIGNQQIRLEELDDALAIRPTRDLTARVAEAAPQFGELMRPALFALPTLKMTTLGTLILSCTKATDPIRGGTTGPFAPVWLVLDTITMKAAAAPLPYLA